MSPSTHHHAVSRHDIRHMFTLDSVVRFLAIMVLSAMLTFILGIVLLSRI